MKCSEIIEILEHLSPKKYACEWDNVGLMVGNPDADIKKILVVLDGDDPAIEKAIETGVDLIVTHHPLIFGGLKSIRTDEFNGSRIFSLIQNNINCYSMHTNFDAKGGMAELAADMIGINDCEVLEVILDGEGFGRAGSYEKEMTVREWAERVKNVFGIPQVCVYGDLDTKVERVAISPGSGKDYISASLEKNAQLLITGDINHHSGIDAVAQGLSIIDAGHYGTEHIFIKFISEYLREQFIGSDLEIVEMDKRFPFVMV